MKREIEIVKRAGLNTNSDCIVRIIDSYLEPATVLLRMPAHTHTMRVLATARAQVPEQFRQHVAIEIARRWSVPAFPAQELLTVLAYCWHFLDALLLYSIDQWHEHLVEAPGEYLRTVMYPPCMYVDPSLVPLLFAADTGNLLTRTFQQFNSDPELQSKAVDRYGEADLRPEDDLVAYAERVHDRARTIFRRDGNHLPAAMLRRASGEWEMMGLVTHDKRDKFVMWHVMGGLAIVRSWTAIIFTGEVWMGPAPDEVPPYFDVSQGSPRREALVTRVEARDGTSASWMSEIVRLVGKPFLRKRTSLDENAVFLEPIRAAWAKWAPPDYGQGRESTANH